MGEGGGGFCSSARRFVNDVLAKMAPGRYTPISGQNLIIPASSVCVSVVYSKDSVDSRFRYCTEFVQAVLF